MSKEAPNLCACGCGKLAKPGRQFIKGHNQGGKESPRKVKPQGDPPLCECGCGNPVEWSQARRRWNRFLNRHGRKGFQHDGQAKAKISEKAKARSDQIAESNRNRVWSEASRRKLSESKQKIRLPHQFGPGQSNPAFKHGHYYQRPSASILMRTRRYLIHIRGFACAECGCLPNEQANLHMHHVDDNPFNNEPSNLRLLCAACHNAIHHPK